MGLFTTDSLSIWRQLAEMNGMKVRVNEEGDVTEWLAESTDDTTITGYFSESDEWGMLTEIETE